MGVTIARLPEMEDVGGLTGCWVVKAGGSP